MGFIDNIVNDLAAVMLNTSEHAELWSWTDVSAGADSWVSAVFVPDQPSESDAQDGLVFEATGRLLMMKTQSGFTPANEDIVTRDGVSWAVIDADEGGTQSGLRVVRIRRITKPETTRPAHRIPRP